jgi:mannose-1-phosphate guanylyltransferase
MHTAFVLAAGLGTRLRPLTDHRPKPLVPVCGVPMLAYALASCARHGLTDVVVNAHWLAEQVVGWEGVREGVRVAISVELPEILGTGGGLRAVRDRLAPRFAVVNADVLSDVDLSALLAAVPPGGAAMALRSDPEPARYGIVAADADHRVVELTTVARADARGPVDRTTHFTGIHAMDRAALDRVPPGFQCIVRTAYRSLVPERRVAGVVHRGIWLDVGDPAAYLDANLAVLDGGLALPLDPVERAGYARLGGRERGDSALVAGVDLDGPVWIGPGAELGRGARVTRSVIGAGARVPAGVELVDSVVWDGVTVPAGAHRRVIVHDGGVHSPA